MTARGFGGRIEGREFGRRAAGLLACLFLFQCAFGEDAEDASSKERDVKIELL